MKRKFFSTLLFGALACTTLSTVTSCKDYDDDIKNLQTQIDQKAALTKITDLETQVAAAKSAAEQAYTEAKAKATPDDVQDALDEARDYAELMADAAEKSAKDAASAALDAYKATVNDSLKNYMLASEIEKKLQELEEKCTEVDNAQEDEIEALATLVANWGSAINTLYSAVTEVSLVGSFTGGQYKSIEGGITLEVSTGTVVNDIVFGKEEKDDKGGKHSATPTVEYKKGTQFGFTDDLLVRVNPTNAVVTPEMIKFIDSKGNDLDDVLEVTEVKKYDKLITRGSDNETGLWVVSAKPKMAKAAFDKAVQSDGKNICYALAVNNTASVDTTVAAADRYVVSSYDVAMTSKAWDVNETLDDVFVYSETTMGENKGLYLSECKSRESSTYDGSEVLSAASGENIIIDPYMLKGAMEHFYVVRDDSHAGESDASEINAWKSYSYEGVGKMYDIDEKGKISVTIPSTAKAGDVISFRVFGINYDGSYTPTNHKTTTGHDFSVYVTDKNVTTSVTGELKANKATTGFATDYLPLIGTLSDNGDKLSIGTNGVTVKVSDDEVWTLNATYYKDNKGTVASKNSEIKYVKFETASGQKATDMTDGATATGQIVVKENAHNTVTDIINVSLTKVMPTAEDALKNLGGLSWKDKQIVNGVYTCYLYPTGDNWQTEAKSGYKDLSQAINDLKYGYLHIDNATLGTKDSNGKQTYDGQLEVTPENAASEWLMTISNEAASRDGALLIDNKTEHNAVFGYNFGQISSVKNANGTYDDYKVDVTDKAFKIIFACPLDPSVQSFNFVQATTTKGGKVDVNEIYYNEKNSLCTNADSLSLNHKSIMRYLEATNTFDNVEFGGCWFSDFTKQTGKVGYDVYKKYIISKSTVTLTSDNNNDEADYFDVAFSTGKNQVGAELVFTQKSGTTNPTEDVQSTLTLKMVDCFGHTNVYKVPFVVKRFGK